MPQMHHMISKWQDRSACWKPCSSDEAFVNKYRMAHRQWHQQRCSVVQEQACSNVTCRLGSVCGLHSRQEDVTCGEGEMSTGKLASTCGNCIGTDAMQVKTDNLKPKQTLRSVQWCNNIKLWFTRSREITTKPVTYHSQQSMILSLNYICFH